MKSLFTRRTVGAVTGLLVAVAVTAGMLPTAAAVGASVPAGSKTTATALLNSLVVAPEITTGYSRDAFNHWITVDGCTVREQVLIRQQSGGKRVGCEIVGGKWFSAYDGVTTTDPGTFDIDHMVPLGQAYASGAGKWSAGQREAYANDLTYRPALIAVSASSNRAKGDKDPSKWMPSNKSGWCSYLKNWVGIKYRWKLTVDKAEKQFIASNLSGCDQKMNTPPVASVPDATTDPGPAPKPEPKPEPPTGGGGGTDPRFSTCGEATAAGYGPYRQGVDAEYEWYQDRDKDGMVCE